MIVLRDLLLAEDRIGIASQSNLDYLILHHILRGAK